MTRDYFLSLAHKAGLIDWFNSESIDYVDFKNAYVRLAELVAAAERERCAKVCELVGATEIDEATGKMFGDAIREME